MMTLWVLLDLAEIDYLHTWANDSPHVTDQMKLNLDPLDLTLTPAVTREIGDQTPCPNPKFACFYTFWNILQTDYQNQDFGQIVHNVYCNVHRVKSFKQVQI